MGFMDIFRRKPIEKRADGTGYTAAIMAARASYIAGVSGIGELTSTVQTCVSLWEGGFALADVQGTDLLPRSTMAVLARSVALRGEFVGLITDRGVLPASDWELSTVDGVPRAYRLSIAEAGGGRGFTALAPEVLHVRIGSDPVAPWTGTAPLRRAALTGQMLHEIENALLAVFRDAPIGSLIVPLPDGSADDMATMRAAFRGRRGSTLVVEGVAQATAAGMNPQIGQRLEQLSPDLSRVMTAEHWAAARGAILAVYGVLPGMVVDAAQGPMVREAQRHLAAWTLQPIAELLAEEATAKLGGPVTVDVIRPLQAFDAGGRARALSQIIEAFGRAKELGLTPAEMQAALTSVNFGGGDQNA
jgi:phage portal protein BeeE